MNLRRSLTILAAVPALLGAQAPKPDFYYIPHTHWEGAVFNTREEYLQFGLDHILEALRLMDEYPDYKFTLDQVAYFKPFIERYPEEIPRFMKYVQQGRLELVGGMDVMPDEVKPGAELLVRQIQYGQSYFQKLLGKPSDVAWLLDTFGHTPQLPQILDQSGFHSFWFSRGVPNPDGPAQFFLKGIDGSTIPAVWLKGFYGLLYGPPRDQAGFDKFFVGNYHYLDHDSLNPDRVGLAGNDVSEPEDFVPPLLHHFNAEPDRPFNIRYSVPTEFANRVATWKNVPTVSIDQSPIFTGTYSSRTELRQTAKQLEQDLLRVEQLGAVSGCRMDTGAIWDAWEPVLFNQTHDLASGTMNDHTYFDTVRQYEVARGMTDNLQASAWNSLVHQIDTSGPGTPIVVYNSQGCARTDSVDADLGFASGNPKAIQLVDPAGHSVPFQVNDSEVYSDGTLKRVKLTFVATGVPACGFAVYHAIPSAHEASRNAPGTGGSTLENEFYRVQVDLKTGAITSIFDKELKSEMLSAPANVIARQADKGDLWTLYHNLDGGQYLPTMDKQPVPSAPSAVLSTAYPEKDGSLVRGPVFDEFKVDHTFEKGHFATRIRLTKGVRRIDIETQLINQTPQVRYQALFPTSIANGNNVQEVAFGAIGRPKDVEFPAQNWVDTSDGKRGMALLNFAMPGNVNAGGTLMLSMLRSVTEGDYNGGDNSNTGLEMGVTRTFRYALVPHAGDWRSAHLAQAGLNFASPLFAAKAESQAGKLGKDWSFLKISNPNVVLSSVQPQADGTALVRVYESTGVSAPGVELRFAGIQSASGSNLLGASLGKIRVHGNAVRFDLHPFEIKTIKVTMR